MIEKWLGIESHDGFDEVDTMGLALYAPVFNEKGQKLFNLKKASMITFLAGSGVVEIFDTRDQLLAKYEIVDLVLEKKELLHEPVGTDE